MLDESPRCLGQYQRPADPDEEGTADLLLEQGKLLRDSRRRQGARSRRRGDRAVLSQVPKAPWRGLSWSAARESIHAAAGAITVPRAGQDNQLVVISVPQSQRAEMRMPLASQVEGDLLSTHEQDVPTTKPLMSTTNSAQDKDYGPYCSQKLIKPISAIPLDLL